MKGGDSLSQLLKNVQGSGSKTSTDKVSMIIIGFIVVGIIAVIVGTLSMVNTIKTTSTPTAVSVSPVTTTSDVDSSSSGVQLGTQQNPLVQTTPQQELQFPSVSSGIDTTGLFNKQTQQPNIADPYSKMQQIGTILFLGPKNIMVQGIEAVNSAYRNEATELELVKQALEGKLPEDQKSKIFQYSQRLFLYGKRFSGNWYYFLTSSNKDAPIINLIVNDRDCGNQQSTGCQELFDKQYYKVNSQMTQYLSGLANAVGFSSENISLLRMKAELYPLKF